MRAAGPLVEVIYQKRARVFDHDIKAWKAYEAREAKPRELFIAFECFDIMVKHERKFLICFFFFFFFEDVEKKMGLKSPKLHTPR